jgi:hypothetical protein
LHAATVVGDTVGDPFKDTSSVALNPVIKFTTLFGLLAVEITMTMQSHNLKNIIGGVLFVVALVFVHRSFYAMRVPEAEGETSSSPDAVATENSKETRWLSDSAAMLNGKDENEVIAPTLEKSRR